MIKDKFPYRILIVEDNPGDFVIVEDLLSEQILTPIITHATNFEKVLNLLTQGAEFDIILLDLSLPDKNGQALVMGILKLNLSCPVIILTGYGNIEFSISSVAQGISDYLLKDELNASMLYKSIIYSLERKKSISELERSQKQFSDLFNLSPQPMWVMESETFRFAKVNKATLSLYGYTEEDFLNMTLLDIQHAEDNSEPASLLALLEADKEDVLFKGLHNKNTGEVIEVEMYRTPITFNNISCQSVIAIDVTLRTRFENKITRAIIKTQDDERYEIGAELHDNVCQILAASQYSLCMLNKTIPQDKIHFLNQSKDEIKKALHEIRNLSHRLAPAFFDDSTLEQAFKTLFYTFNLEEHIQVLLEFDDSVEEYPLSLEIQLNLYRIIQEQVKNILKYAEADVIKVTVMIINYKLKMQIIDNGIGFDFSTAKKGIGLANMKRRTELFSGKFEIISSPGNGCSVVVEIPLIKNNTPVPQ